MKNGWTTGQFAVFRLIFGLYLVWHLVALLPWGAEIFSAQGVLPDRALSPLINLFPNIFLLSDSSLFVSLCLCAGVVCSVFFLIGKFDRIAAVLIWYLWACLYARNPLIANPSLPFIGWLLLAYALTPSRTSSAANLTKGCSWRLPAEIYLVAWVVVSCAYLYSGYTKLTSPSWVDGSALSHVLANPLARDTVLRTFLLSLPQSFLKIATWSALALELSFAPLALSRRLRPFVWLSMAGLHCGLLLLINFSDLTAAMLIVHLFLCDPAWIRSPQPANEAILFDGECGLCHWLVRLVLQEDGSAQPFCFAPLHGNFCQAKIPDEVCRTWPDSIVVLDAENNLLTRSTAVIYVMKRLGGLWYAAAMILEFIPKALRDLGYAFVAAARRFSPIPATGCCPLIPFELRARFRD